MTTTIKLTTNHINSKDWIQENVWKRSKI